MANVIHQIVYPQLGIIDEFVEEIPDEKAPENADEGEGEKINKNFTENY
jgi:hypothetical protein